MTRDYAPRLGKFTGLEQPATLRLGTFQAPEFSATRLTGPYGEDGTPIKLQTSDAYLVCLERHYLPSAPYWVDGRPAYMAPRVAGQFMLLDLNREHSSVQKGRTDCLSVYISRHALIKFQEEHDVRPSALRSADGDALNDTVVHNIIECLLPAVDQPNIANRLFVDHVGVALMSHLSSTYALHGRRLQPPAGGLAVWQERRAKDTLMAHLDGKISLEELAKACGLSRSHFARAFKVATGVSPLEWLAQQRIALAQQYLRHSSLPVEDIAERCGFADQSHFTRAFSRHVGETPGRWRRSLAGMPSR
ncbi:AraC family transcriptional regulator [Mesorhizobium sp. BAC0120]|uniref:AraC family transcriptional regulator n=1 Tax=Mesorhizobium sp. BAC0120 TaxID=3090670 RepID=UPI00298C89D2|nr:AraC family transcriptional regulator [Mesorhizobium sp. BAC0120]MDW6020393.1 AraC family transcriptional regulator [Mesorhizobium sp. BAC0120]